MDLVKAIEIQESDASSRGTLAEEREEALDHYLGRPYGDEQEGRSHVVMRDVADTIEWIKPSLLKIFCAGDEVVRFDPVGPGDEAAAMQETDFCNHVVMQKNNGFLIFHDWFHDALLQKNGYVVVRPVTKKRTNREQFKGLTDDEFASLLKTEGVELLEHTEYESPGGTIEQPMMVKLHDAVLRSTSKYECIDIANIPPERVLVHKDWSGLNFDGCPFVEIIDYKTISALREEGYEVDDDINDQAMYSDDEEFEDARNILDDGDVRDSHEDQGPNRSVRVRYVWIRHDQDEDGVAELRRVVVVGKTVLEDEEDDITPVACLTPSRMPHEHVGLSIDDIVHDLQRIRTVLVRGFLDGMYLSMHGRNAIDTTRVNLDDMLVTRPGGVVRVQGSVQNAIMPLYQPQNGQPVLQAIEYVDTVRENRTGVTRYNQGLDSDTLNKTAHGINSIMTASQQRIELIARMFAETGVKALMLIVHALSIKYGRQPEMLKLRGNWVPVDPRGWKTRQDMTVSVGIGTGNKDQMLQHLFMILQEQKQGMAVGLADPSKIHNTLRRLTQNAGFKQTDEFWTDPAQKPPQPPGPPPEVQREQMKIQADQQKTQAQMQADAAKAQQEQQMRMLELQFEASEKEKDRQAELEKERLRIAAQIELKRMDAQVQSAFKAEDRQFQQEDAQRSEFRQQEVKAGESAKIDQVISELTQVLGGLSQAMSRPLKVVRGQDGRAAEIH